MSEPSHDDYRPDIDGLRALAVLAVLANHLSTRLLPGGYVGVDVFFVISGYLITRIIQRELAQGSFSFRRFYERRARRIFPALFAVLGATLVAGYLILLPSDYVVTLRAALGTLAFASNFVFWRTQGYFEGTDSKLNPLLHTWSLAVEEQFYLLFPVVLLLCHRYLRQKTGVILMLIAAVSWIFAAAWLSRRSSAIFYLAPFRAWELLAGSLLALGVLPVIRLQKYREALTAAGLAAIAGACVLYHDGTAFPGPAAMAPVLGAVAIIHAGAGAGSGATLVGRLLQLRPLVYVGLISYSLYLWHWPVIVFWRYANGFELSVASMPVVLVLSLVLGSLSYHFIEKPFRRGLPFKAPVASISAGVFASGALVFCALGLAASGLASRFPPQVAALDRARSPEIPFEHCSNKAPRNACILGTGAGQPDVLLWGDSHLISWAPALQEVFTQADRQAVMVATLACPPMFDTDSTINSACVNANEAVKNYLAANPHIKTVVMSGFWQTYFRDGGPLRTELPGQRGIRGHEAARIGLAHTRQWLLDRGRELIVIGPAPVYARDVPATLALEAHTGRSILNLSVDAQRLKHAMFQRTVDGFSVEPQTRILDPIDWLCQRQCRVSLEGVPWYRDAHHLNVEGVMAMRPFLARDLGLEPSGVGESLEEESTR